MKRKRLRIVAIALLIGSIAAIPASTQVLRSVDGAEERANAQMLVLVNRMELSVGQMEQIHGLLGGLLTERDANELRLAELKRDLIAFIGTAEELDELLATFRAGTGERMNEARDRIQDVMDQLKEILTARQGEILDEIFPRFLGGGSPTVQPDRLGGFSGQQGTMFPSDVRGGMLGRLAARFPDRAEVLEQLQQRVRDGTSRGALQGEMAIGGREGTERQGLGQVGWSLRARPGEPMRRGLDWIEQLYLVLELKLGAIGP